MEQGNIPNHVPAVHRIDDALQALGVGELIRAQSLTGEAIAAAGPARRAGTGGSL